MQLMGEAGEGELYGLNRMGVEEEGGEDGDSNRFALAGRATADLDSRSGTEEVGVS